MLALLLLKRYELATGRIFLASARPGIGAFFHRKLVWLEHVLPGLIRAGLHNLYRAVRRALHLGAAWAVLRLEQGLERTLRTLRRNTMPQARMRSGEETSAFLREVAEHKKRLQDEMPGQRITEE